jgi:hypothetical protein
MLRQLLHRFRVPIFDRQALIEPDVFDKSSASAYSKPTQKKPTEGPAKRVRKSLTSKI